MTPDKPQKNTDYRATLDAVVIIVMIIVGTILYVYLRTRDYR